MTVQELRKRLLMASDAAEVRISFREIMVDNDYWVVTPVGGTLYDMADDSFTLYEPEVTNASAVRGPDSPDPNPSA